MSASSIDRQAIHATWARYNESLELFAPQRTNSVDNDGTSSESPIKWYSPARNRSQKMRVE
jgi:hypothetical protein